jgi:hypothetical protein
MDDRWLPSRKAGSRSIDIAVPDLPQRFDFAAPERLRSSFTLGIKHWQVEYR